MNELTTYRDEATGYTIRQYTKGPERNTKLYFTTENFTTDDQYFFFNKGASSDLNSGLCMAHVESGEYEVVAGEEYSRFAMDRFENYGVMARGNIVCRFDCGDRKITELGALPEGCKITGHLTTANDGTVVCSIQQKSCIYALVTLDPKTGKSEIVYQSDYHLGHTQVCPSDSNLIFYIHETGGDALQRTWMFDVAHRMARPYYVEHPNEWITHEVWSADGSKMLFMKLPNIMVGDKDGRHFDQLAQGVHYLHPCFSRDMQWVCADQTSYWGMTVPDGVFLINAKSGSAVQLAQTGAPQTGADHAHPSFNRRGDMVLFSRPFTGGYAQVALIDLSQVERPQ